MVRVDTLERIGKNHLFIEYDGWHFEGTIRQVINELLSYERREPNKDTKGGVKK